MFKFLHNNVFYFQPHPLYFQSLTVQTSYEHAVNDGTLKQKLKDKSTYQAVDNPMTKWVYTISISK